MGESILFINNQPHQTTTIAANEIHRLRRLLSRRNAQIKERSHEDQDERVVGSRP